MRVEKQQRPKTHVKGHPCSIQAPFNYPLKKMQVCVSFSLRIHFFLIKNRDLFQLRYIEIKRQHIATRKVEILDEKAMTFVSKNNNIILNLFECSTRFNENKSVLSFTIPYWGHAQNTFGRNSRNLSARFKSDSSGVYNL